MYIYTAIIQLTRFSSAWYGKPGKELEDAGSRPRSVLSGQLTLHPWTSDPYPSADKVELETL